MLRLLHTADLHLDARFPGLGHLDRRRRDDFSRTFQRLVELALSEQVELFVVAGDLFDSARPAADSVKLVQAELRRLVDHGIQPVLLPGTHDGVYGGGIYAEDRFAGCVILDTLGEPRHLKLAGGDVYLYGAPFLGGDPTDVLNQLQRLERPGLHLGLLHGSLQGSPEWDYRDKDLPFTREMLLGWDLDYLALGHYHRLQLIEEQGRVFAAYPGSPEGKRFGEDGERYALLVELEPRQARVTPRAVQQRRLASLQLNTGDYAGRDELVQAVLNRADSDLLLRLTLTGSSDEPFDAGDLQQHCADAFYYLEVDDRSCFLDTALAGRLADEDTIRGHCVRKFKALLDQSPERREVIELALREVLIRFQQTGG